MAQKILVLSGKGGVGKSTVTVCLAEAVTALGKKALCIDADIGFRSLDLIMGTGSEAVYNWLDVVNGNCTAQEALVKKNDSLFLLSAPSVSGIDTNKEKFGEMLSHYDGQFDFIFLDAPAGSGEIHKILASVSDSALLVVTPDAVSVRSADIAVDRALEVNGELKPRMIINRFKKSEVLSGRQLKLDDVINLTHTQLIGVIPESDSVRLMVSGGPLAESPRSAFYRTAQRLNGEQVIFNKRYFS
ncbi:MAG: septum site-determining protein MinD [Ruminococcaceae bacterium]|nr:septum site-determining protein MinD [Oscillospiraceae bacterium]